MMLHVLLVMRIEIATGCGRWLPLDKTLFLKILETFVENVLMQIQVNVDITIVLITIVELIRVILMIHEENKKR